MQTLGHLFSHTPINESKPLEQINKPLPHKLEKLTPKDFEGKKTNKKIVKKTTKVSIKPKENVPSNDVNNSNIDKDKNSAAGPGNDNNDKSSREVDPGPTDGRGGEVSDSDSDGGCVGVGDGVGGTGTEPGGHTRGEWWIGPTHCLAPGNTGTHTGHTLQI